MESHLHWIVGLYTSLAEADAARVLIVAQGMAPTQVRVPAVQMSSQRRAAIATAS
jgi:hypothetical protein